MPRYKLTLMYVMCHAVTELHGCPTVQPEAHAGERRGVPGRGRVRQVAGQRGDPRTS